MIRHILPAVAVSVVFAVGGASAQVGSVPIEITVKNAGFEKDKLGESGLAFSDGGITDWNIDGGAYRGVFAPWRPTYWSAGQSGLYHGDGRGCDARRIRPGQIIHSGGQDQRVMGRLESANRHLVPRGRRL